MEDWPLWRIVLAGMATWEEINRSWSLADVVRANHALSLHLEIQLELMRPADGDS